MKKLTTMLVSLVLVIALIGCSSSTNQGNGASSGGSDSGGQSSGGSSNEVTIKMLNYKVEIVNELDEMVREYEQEHPGIKIQVETVGGDADQAAALRAKFNSGNAPDIFINGGYKDLDLWIDYLEDLSDEPWAKHVVDVAREPLTKDGKLYGQPLGLEGYGFIYNKDLFEQAGITQLPKTLDELEQVAEQLQQAGITPFVNGYGVWWVLGNHLSNIAFAHQDDPDAFIKGLDEGTEQFMGNPVFEQWFDLIDLTVKYGNRNPLQTDYNTQLTDFATGKAAMTQQGNWMQEEIMKANPDMRMGFIPMPINNDAAKMDKLPVSIPYGWVINKDSPVKQEAKDFLNWMVMSETGQRYMVEKFKFIPAFDHVEGNLEDLGQLANEIIRYTSEGKVMTWNFFKYPGGEASSHQFADAIQAYIAGQKTREETLQSFQQTWEDLLQ